MSKRRLVARLCVLPVAAALGLLTVGTASAHVSISPDEGTAGSYSVLTVSVPHGCDGSPTTKVAIKIPERIQSITPTRNSLWDAEKVMTELDQPATDSHGNKVTERVGKVVYTAKRPLPPGYRDSFELSVQLPETPGKTLVFPTVQTCEQGETAWIQVPASGQSAHDLSHPAPAVKILPARAKPASADSAASADTTRTAAESDSSQSSAWGIAGLIAGVLGLAIGTAAFLRTRKQS